jgi:tRNA-2-methylthio-N6-dimethylallyladenosine synthase
MPRYHVWTIGCQMNKADSECICVGLEQMGFHSVRRLDDADVVVLNSCVVRQSAEDRVTHKLDSLCSLGRGKVLALTGCFVDSDVDELKRRFPRVDVWFAPQDFDTFFDYLQGRGMASRDGDTASISARAKPSEFVNIIHGCDNFCAYCIVPYRRGRERSRPMGEIVCEVESLAERGAKEVTLLGQNVDSYGHDLPDKPTLADLLAGLNRIDGLSRIRFLTSHPKDISQGLIAAMSQLDKVCENVSLPLQAGDDDILKAMRRGYTVAQYKSLVERMRHAIPHIALSTDVIVGFPGESQRQFQKTYDVLRELRFDTVHIAAYSPRTGTIAARQLADDVSLAEKIRRRKMLEGLQEGIAAEINAGLLGRTVEVLVEGRKKGRWWGRTRTDKLVFFEDEADRFGRLVTVKIEKTRPWSLQGTIEVA